MSKATRRKPRVGSCTVCGTGVTAGGRGPIPKYCARCDPHGNASPGRSVQPASDEDRQARAHRIWATTETARIAATAGQFPLADPATILDAAGVDPIADGRKRRALVERAKREHAALAIGEPKSVGIWAQYVATMAILEAAARIPTMPPGQVLAAAEKMVRAMLELSGGAVPAYGTIELSVNVAGERIELARPPVSTLDYDEEPKH